MSIDVAALERNGYLVVADLLDSEWITALKAEEARFSAQQDRALNVTTQLVHQSQTIRQFVTSGPAVALANQVLGPDVCFTHQQFVSKQPDQNKRTDVPFHQDNGYGRLEPVADLTVWITLDDCDERNGCLWVVPGSHQRGLLPHTLMHGLMGIADDRLENEAIPVPLKAGSAVLFNSLLVHRSLPNETQTSRVAVYVRYCHPGVVMANADNKPVLEDSFSWMVTGEAGIS